MMVYVLGYACNQETSIIGKEGMRMEKKIRKLKRITQELAQLALEIGTLIAIIKMIVESIL